MGIISLYAGTVVSHCHILWMEGGSVKACLMHMYTLTLLCFVWLTYHNTGDCFLSTPVSVSSLVRQPVVEFSFVIRHNALSKSIFLNKINN